MLKDKIEHSKDKLNLGIELKKNQKNNCQNDTVISIGRVDFANLAELVGALVGAFVGAFVVALVGALVGALVAVSHFFVSYLPFGTKHHMFSF